MLLSLNADFLSWVMPLEQTTLDFSYLKQQKFIFGSCDIFSFKYLYFFIWVCQVLVVVIS